MTNDVILFADVFEKFGKVSTKDFRMNPLDCVRLTLSTYQCALEYTDNILQILQHKDLILTLENNIRGVSFSVMGDRYIVSDDKK